MDNHPPVRRPHKSPAHTFKDPGLQPQRFVLHPVVTEVPEGAAHYTAVLDSVNTVNRIFFCCPTASFPSGGSIILASLHVSSTARFVIFLPPRSRFRLPGRASYSSFRIRQAFPSPPFPRPAGFVETSSAGRALCTCTSRLGRGHGHYFAIGSRRGLCCGEAAAQRMPCSLGLAPSGALVRWNRRDEAIQPGARGSCSRRVRRASGTRWGAKPYAKHLGRDSLNEALEVPAMTCGK